MNTKKEKMRMKRLWLLFSVVMATAFNLAVTIAQFWKPMDIEHPVACFIIWVVTEAYLLFFLYVNVFDRMKKK